MKIKKLLRRLIYRYKANSEVYIQWLIKQGVTIGGGVKFIDPRTGWIDITRPWMIKIGNNVTITPGVTILTHDYSWSVIAVYDNCILGSVGQVHIGDNVFIGQNTTILAGTTIGNNVIIGANSLVKKDIPDNVVVAGNPVKIVCTLDEFIEKRKIRYVKETKEMAKLYYEKYKLWPDKELFYENFWIFENEYTHLEPYFQDVFNWTQCDKEKMLDKFNTHKKIIDSYEKLIEICKQEIKKEE